MLLVGGSVATEVESAVDAIGELFGGGLYGTIFGAAETFGSTPDISSRGVGRSTSQTRVPTRTRIAPIAMTPISGCCLIQLTFVPGVSTFTMAGWIA